MGLFTYAQICVDIDLSKVIPNIMLLKHGIFKRIQSLDYENTTFTCQFYHQTSHLQDSCPQEIIHSKRNKKHYFKSKSWHPYEPPL